MTRAKYFVVGLILILGLVLIGFTLFKFIQGPEKTSASETTEQLAVTPPERPPPQQTSTDEKIKITPIELEDRDLSTVLLDPLKLTVQDINVANLKETDKDVYGFSEGRGAEDYEFCKEIGARVVHVPEYSSYFVYWVPDNWDEIEEKRAMVLMHGSLANAYARIPHLYELAKSEGFALISVQWGWPVGNSSEYTYLHDSEEGLRVAYHLMTLGLDYVELHYGLDKHLSAWNGFSRGSSASVGYAYLDKESGNNYFKIFMGIAGAIHMQNDFIVSIIQENKANVLDTANFYLWCGTDNLHERDGGDTVQTCDTMLNDVAMLNKAGTNIEFVETEGGKHFTWNNDTSIQKEAYDLWINSL